MSVLFFFQAEDGIRDLVRSRGLGDVYKRQRPARPGTAARIGDNDSVVPWGAAGEDVHHAQALSLSLIHI